MRKDKELGISVSLAQDCELDSIGVLKATTGTQRSYGMTEKEIDVFLLVATSGTAGLSLSKLSKVHKDETTALVLSLELKGLIQMQRDLQGRLNMVTLTWQGDEAFEAARKSSKPAETGGIKFRPRF